MISYYKNGFYRYYIQLVTYISINLALFCWAWHQYQKKKADSLTCLARGSASMIHLNFILIMVSMMRVSISRLKYYRIAHIFALDKHINIHKMSGNVIFFSGLLHSFAYIYKSYEFLFNKVAVALFIILSIIWLCAQKHIRKTRYFELFYYSHYLFIPALILLCLHAPHIIWYMTLPILGYIFDRMYRFYCTFYPSQILDSKMWPGDILELSISRPKNFNYYPGDYTYVCIPGVSKLQWHPFTLSSDPHNKELITLHMRVLGNWTRQVGELCLNFQKEKHKNKLTFQPLIYLDGPLSTPASSAVKHDNVLLIAQGIGATPFISLLKYYMSAESLMKNKQIDLIWMSRDDKTYDWCMQEVLKPIVGDKSKYHNNIRIRFLTNQKVSSIDWKNELQYITKHGHGYKPTIYICGSPELGDIISELAPKFGCTLKNENF